MDFGLLPPEVNSSRMYSGPGPESMLAAAAAWDGVAAELTSAAVSYGSVVSTLIVEPWMGPAAAGDASRRGRLGRCGRGVDFRRGLVWIGGVDADR